MWKKPKEWSLIKKKIKSWIRKNKVVDVIVFGSYVRSKYKPNDIDLMIVVHDAQEKQTFDLIDSLSKIVDKFGHNFQINSMTEKGFIRGDSTLVKTLLAEGVSMLKNRKISELYGYKAYSLFNYTLKGFRPSKRVRFHYLLRGRNHEKGILDEVGGEIIGSGVIKVPTSQEDLMKEIFKKWNVNFKTQRALFES